MEPPGLDSGLLAPPGQDAGLPKLPELDCGVLGPPGQPWTIVQPPSAALPWEAHMLCWLAFGEHEALEIDLTGIRILIPA